MNKIISKKNYLKVLITLLIPISFTIFKPFNLTTSQSIVLGSLFVTISWWATGWVYKDFASFYLITVFIFFGNTSFKNIFFFPLSENFILVVSSFLISKGIVNSKVADNFSEFILTKYCYNSKRLVIMSFVLGILLIFIIPQPFPRIILLAAIYTNFLKNAKISKESERIIILSIFVASTVTSLMFLNGDVVVNYAAMKFGGINLTYLEWAKYMTLPTILTTLIVLTTYLLIFKKDLNNKFNFKSKEELSITKDGKKAIFITLIIISLWMTESFHGITPGLVALLGTILMFIFCILSIEDFKAVNISLLIFLTAQFSIGKVLTSNGTAQEINVFLIEFFPNSESILYIPFIVLLVMGLHMIFGSLITALAIPIPTLLTVAQGNLSPEFIVLLTAASVCFHFILPFHHVSIMIGFGSGFYNNKQVIKIGLALTIVTFFSVILIYVPWWNFLGLNK